VEPDNGTGGIVKLGPSGFGLPIAREEWWTPTPLSRIRSERFVDDLVVDNSWCGGGAG
jgi:hypothetical protein